MQPNHQAIVQTRVILPTDRVRDLVAALAGQLARHAARSPARRDAGARAR